MILMSSIPSMDIPGISLVFGSTCLEYTVLRVFSKFSTGKEKEIAWSILIIQKKIKSYNFHGTIIMKIGYLYVKTVSTKSFT